MRLEENKLNLFFDWFADFTKKLKNKFYNTTQIPFIFFNKQNKVLFNYNIFY